MSYVPLSLGDLALSSVLVAALGALSAALRLGLERTIALSALRMVLQLALVSLVLKFNFEVDAPLWTTLPALLMLAAAIYEVKSRQSRPLAGWQPLVLGAGSAFAIGLLATFLATAVIIAPEPWYAPRYVLPILGMMLGNALAGVCLVLETMTDGAVRGQREIEARLALGASRFEAMGGLLRRAITTGTMPILTSMAATGVIALPGMMTGQILAGIEPIDAAKYQIMIMLLIAGATGLAVVAAGTGCLYLLTDERHRLRLDRIAVKEPPA